LEVDAADGDRRTQHWQWRAGGLQGVAIGVVFSGVISTMEPTAFLGEKITEKTRCGRINMHEDAVSNYAGSWA
jgi:hypothetical protein